METGIPTEYSDGQVTGQILKDHYKFDKCLWKNLYTSVRRYKRSQPQASGGTSKASDTRAGIYDMLDGHPTVIVKTYELDHPAMADHYKAYIYCQVMQEYQFCRDVVRDRCFTEVLGLECKKKFNLSEFPIIRLFMKDYKDGDLKAWRDKLSKENVEVPMNRIESMARDIIKSIDLLGTKYNLIHRDAKPDNFFIDGERVVLADFENAIPSTKEAIDKEASSKVHIDMTGSFYFRPGDLSTHYIDSEWDAFSLGLTLYFLIAGHLIYDKTSQCLLPFAAAIADGKVNFTKDCPAWLQCVVRKCLSNRDERISWWREWRFNVRKGMSEDDAINAMTHNNESR